MNFDAMNSTINLGDIIFSFLFFCFAILIISLLVLLTVKNKKRKKQLNRIEEKIDNLQK